MLSAENVYFQPFDGCGRPTCVLGSVLASSNGIPKDQNTSKFCIPKCILQIARADVCYLIGGTWADIPFFRLCRFLRKPVVMHWVGSDVLRAMKAFEQGRLSQHVVETCNHWAEVPWTAEELSSVGIPAEVVPLGSSLVATARVSPLPETFTVLTLLRSTKPIFYGAHHILRLAREIPEIRIICVGHNESPFHLICESLPSNINLLGQLDNLGSAYAESTVLVRMTEHDGLSFMVLEALAHGRYVIWSYPLNGVPGAYLAREYETMFQHVQALYERHVQGRLPPNREGAEFVRFHYDPARVAEGICARLRALVRR